MNWLHAAKQLDYIAGQLLKLKEDVDELVCFLTTERDEANIQQQFQNLHNSCHKASVRAQDIIKNHPWSDDYDKTLQQRLRQEQLEEGLTQLTLDSQPNDHA